jgi:NAD-dependent deacetylase
MAELSNLQYWQTISEIGRNVAQILVFAGGVVALLKWLHERRDRATEVLLSLDEKFNSEKMCKARELIDDDREYKKVRKALLDEVCRRGNFETSDGGVVKGDGPVSSDEMKAIDDLLHFYVLLCGVREAKQVPDSALAKCFRYWLAHYYHPGRRELRYYINTYYPTLTQWLSEDLSWFKRNHFKSFFGPERFGWTSQCGPKIKHIRRAVNARVLIITGAGISADSGIPTYRGKSGYWRHHNPLELATRVAFETNPQLVWEWYCERRELLERAKPNEAHYALAETFKDKDYLLITQNVDDLHERAGTDPERLVHIHGEIRTNKCSRCDYRENVCLQRTPLLPCPRCTELLRPGVIWFDEELETRQVQRVENFLKQESCDLVLIIGTSAGFDYIVDWALRGISPSGSLVEINPHPTSISVLADRAFRKRACIAVPRLFRTRSWGL